MPTDFKKFLPSQRKYLSGVGMSALRTGCLPRLVCVAASSSDPDKKAASQMCGSARSALTQTVQPNLRGAEWIAQQWQAARLSAADAGKAGAVLVLDEIQKIPNWSEAVKRLWDEVSGFWRDKRMERKSSQFVN